MEIRLSAAARMKALGTINNWPSDNRGTMKLMDRLAAPLELTDADREAVRWQVIEREGQTFYSYRPTVVLTCEMPDEDVRTLRRIIEPSAHATYTRLEKPLLAELEAALGELT